jgi:pimeloyl-ACP methyl ester carboxylesterase
VKLASALTVISSAENKSDFGVLLLHGAAFSSKTWETIGTLQKLSEWGFSTISIDLPSYKHSKKVVIPKQKADYLHHIRNHFEILKNHNFILVTPSMSGGYAIPFLLQSKFLRIMFKGTLDIFRHNNVKANFVP